MICKNEVQNPVQNPNNINSQAHFIFRVRMIWRDLASWLRAYKTGLYGGIGNTDEVSERLFRIPGEYGGIIGLFFGRQAAEQFAFLLTRYITLLQRLFAAQMNKDVDAVNDLTQQAYQNVNETAVFLTSINPYWTQGEWVALLSSFTAMQIDEGTTFLTGEYARNIDIFDRILSLTTIIGDYFSEGMADYFSLMQRPAF